MSQSPNNAFRRKLLPISNVYDDALCGSTWYFRLYNRLFWAEPDTDWCARTVLSYLPVGFRGRLLDVPAGTGVFTADAWAALQDAEIDCLDYSEQMLARFQARLGEREAPHIRFQQGDVGALPYADATFDVVFSMNGLHCFPDKDAAFREMHRVLRPGGVFIACTYIQGALRRSDFFVQNVYARQGIFRPPFDTLESLRTRLEKEYYIDALVRNKAFGAFRAVKK